MKRPGTLTLIIAMLLTGLVASAQQKVTVAIASNVQLAMEQIKKNFEKETGIQVALITGASGKLCAQITEGAPFDIFVSADMKYPDALYRKRLASPPRAYAVGQLVVWTAGTGLSRGFNFRTLTSATIKKIAIANPETAPYGTASVEALKYYKVYETVKDKLVYGENIGQTLQFVATEAADAGFIARSQLMADEMKNKGHWTAIDPKAYSPIVQCAVVLKHGKDTNDKISEQFYQYLYSPGARAVFIRFGYTIPQQ